MLSLFIIGCGLVVLGVLLEVIGVYNDEFPCFLGGALAIMIGMIIAVSVGTSVSDQWQQRDEVFLVPVAEGQYLIEDQDTYIYKQSTSSNNGKTEIIEVDKNVTVRKETVQSGEKPYVTKHEKTGWTKTETMYIFYIPAEEAVLDK